MFLSLLGPERPALNLISRLPRDVIAHELATWLHPIGLCFLGSTCKDLRWLLDDVSVWRRLVVLNFGEDWKSTLAQMK
jgi:hypothetical protein